MDECEILEWSTNEKHSSPRPSSSSSMVGATVDTVKSSHEKVELCRSDGTTPKRIRDGEFSEFLVTIYNVLQYRLYHILVSDHDFHQNHVLIYILFHSSSKVFIDEESCIGCYQVGDISTTEYFERSKYYSNYYVTTSSSNTA